MKQCFNIIRRFSNQHVNVKIKAPPVASKAELISEMKKEDLPLIQEIKDEILQKGPITFNRYWEIALGHQKHGYYMKRDVFNTKGDFITSVEISQMFGEILGIWVINLLSQLKAINLDAQQTKKDQKQYSVLEFGPGKGTLMCDVIKVLHQFNLLNGVEINFIEMSPFLRKMQQEAVQKVLSERGIYLKYDNYVETQTIDLDIEQKEMENQDEQSEQVQEMESFSNEDQENYIKVRWFSTYEQMMMHDFGAGNQEQLEQKLENSVPIAILAHEFFDALPTNIFQYVEGKGWREKLVNIAPTNEQDQNFEFHVAEIENDNVKKLLNPSVTFSEQQLKDIKDGDTYEIQPKSAVIANAISELISKVNGGALIIDYGENHSFSNSVRGIRKHKFVEQDDMLEYPGELDLSAYVNFAHLTSATKSVEGIRVGGPMPQGYFLESMGLNARLEALCNISDKKQSERLESEYYRIVAPEEMGQVYKCYYIGREENGDVFPFLSEKTIDNDQYF